MHESNRTFKESFGPENEYFKSKDEPLVSRMTSKSKQRSDSFHDTGKNFMPSAKSRESLEIITSMQSNQKSISGGVMRPNSQSVKGSVRSPFQVEIESTEPDKNMFSKPGQVNATMTPSEHSLKNKKIVGVSIKVNEVVP